MAETFKETVPLSILDGSDGLVEVTFSFTPGRPATPPAYSHGGLPPEDPEFEIIVGHYVREDDSIIAVPVLFGDPEEEKIVEWLAENWDGPPGPDPDDMRDAMIDERLG